MRRFGRLMPRIAEWGNVATAYRRAAAGSRDSVAVANFAAAFERNVNGIVEELSTGTWEPGSYMRFVVRDPKTRVIHAAPFRDRVVHHSIMSIGGPYFECGAANVSFACRKGRGNRAAVQHAAGCTRRFRCFLKLDVRRYFDSIPHEVLCELFRRRFKDRGFLEFLERILRSFHTAPGTGIPIGSLTSQYFANFYLDALDHWIRHSLGCSAYARYMDDMVLWHDDPEVLETWRHSIQKWLQTERGLELKDTRSSGWSRDGLPFLGYRITPRGVLLSRASRRRFGSRLATYEREFTEGRMTGADLQRRVDALLAFTEVATCTAWRRRLLTTRSRVCPLQDDFSGFGFGAAR